MKNFFMSRGLGWAALAYYAFTLGVIAFLYFFTQKNHDLLGDPDLWVGVWVIVSCIMVPLLFVRGIYIYKTNGFSLMHIVYFGCSAFLVFVMYALITLYISCAQGSCL